MMGRKVIASDQGCHRRSGAPPAGASTKKRHGRKEYRSHINYPVHQVFAAASRTGGQRNGDRQQKRPGQRSRPGPVRTPIELIIINCYGGSNKGNESPVVPISRPLQCPGSHRSVARFSPPLPGIRAANLRCLPRNAGYSASGQPTARPPKPFQHPISCGKLRFRVVERLHPGSFPRRTARSGPLRSPREPRPAAAGNK